MYEDELRARDGVRIVVLSASGQEKEVVAESAAQDGKDIVTTIDLDVQQTLYEGMGDDEGAAVAMDAQTARCSPWSAHLPMIPMTLPTAWTARNGRR